MNSNSIESVLDKYYNTFLERNDMAQIVITPQYVEDNRQKMEEMVRLFTLYPDYLVDVITPADSYFKLYFYQQRSPCEASAESNQQDQVTGFHKFLLSYFA